MVGFKRRSLPNNKTIGRYFSAYMLLTGIFLIYNFFYFTLIADGISLVVPDFFLLAIPIVFIAIYNKIESEAKIVHRHDVGKIIMLIQVKQVQALTEALDEKPEVLTYRYQNKSLTYWAKYYNNPKAHSIIATRMALYVRSLHKAAM